MSIKAKTLANINDFFERAKLAIEKCEKKPETKLEIEFEHVLKSYFEQLGLPDIEGQYEQRAGNIFIVTRKRQDATYGKVIIEYESVGRLTVPSGKAHALKQIKDDYLSSYQKNQREKMVGVVFDGKTIIFVRWIEDEWDIDERDFDRHNFEMLVNYLIGLYKISFIELPNQFGFARTKTREALKLLYKKSFKKDKRAKMLFDEWNLRYSSIYGNAFSKDKIKKHFKEFAKEIGLETIEENKLVFTIHTYYAFIVKLIASEVAKNLFQNAESHIKTLLKSEDLAQDLKEIEDGKFFKDIGVDNFVEGTFLSWYLDVWDSQIEEKMRDIIASLDWFDFAEFITKPEYVVDYLKNFYQEVFPKALRHDLGEFYTPDWLAKYVVSQTSFDGDIEKRVLDPACGSGTFLIAILNRIYKKYKKESKKEELVKSITKNVVGFDINPVAVLTARTNYLIALSRFNLQKACLALPIYLTDSIVLPELQNTLGENVVKSYGIKSSKGVFRIPFEARSQVVPLMQFLKDSVEKELDVKNVRVSLDRKFGFSQPAIDNLALLYSRLLVLSSHNENKIWCDIIMNQFATLFQGEFDFIIGNPPWVNWEYLDDAYQEQLRNINDDYGLYFTKGLKSRLGTIRRDISAIFFYVCSDVYLKDSGTIAFLTKPMYQISSGRGFRNFNRIPIGLKKTMKLESPLKVIQMEILTKENPFDIHNEVSMIIAKKGEKTDYPVLVKKWAGKQTHELEDYKAEPSEAKDKLSSWLIYKGKKTLGARGELEYTIREGVNFGGCKEAFYDLEILIDKGNFVQIKNRAGKIKDIEPQRIYPLVMSRHIKKWKLDDNGEKYTYCIVPQSHPAEKNETQLKKECPETWAWLNDFRKQLLARKSSSFAKDPFYSIFGLGDWDSKYKVIWKSMGFYPDFVVVSSVKDKHIGKKVIVAEHVQYFIPTKNEDEAYYICAVLNSSIVKKTLLTLSSGGKSALSQDIIKKIKLEKFSTNNRHHKALANLSKMAHQFADADDEHSLRRIQMQINDAVEQLYEDSRQRKPHVL
jgi:type I restriction-modification system DNA methylase subunit